MPWSSQYEPLKMRSRRRCARSRGTDTRSTCRNGTCSQQRRATPAWVQTFMSPAGWEHYSTLREEAGHLDRAALAITEPVPTRGVAGFHLSNAVQAVPFLNQAQDTAEALAAEIGAEIGEPHERCGCTFYYRSEPYQMCPTNVSPVHANSEDSAMNNGRGSKPYSLVDRVY